MVTVTIKTSFDAAHVLSGYSGKCGNLHGHTYKLEVTVGTTETNKMGMVVDYNVLKPAVNRVASRYDHAFLCGYEDPSELEDVCLKLGYKIKYIKGYSSTENMAKQLAEELMDAAAREQSGWKLVKVRLAETDSTYAEVLV